MPQKVRQSELQVSYVCNVWSRWRSDVLPSTGRKASAGLFHSTAHACVRWGQRELTHAGQEGAEETVVAGAAVHQAVLPAVGLGHLDIMGRGLHGELGLVAGGLGGVDGLVLVLVLVLVVGWLVVDGLLLLGVGLLVLVLVTSAAAGDGAAVVGSTAAGAAAGVAAGTTSCRAPRLSLAARKLLWWPGSESGWGGRDRRAAAAWY